MLARGGGDGEFRGEVGNSRVGALGTIVLLISHIGLIPNYYSKSGVRALARREGAVWRCSLLLAVSPTGIYDF